MSKTEVVSSFLTNLLNSREQLINVFGSSIVFNAKQMLIADILSENIESLTEVIKEHLEINLNCKQNSFNSYEAAF